MLSGRETLGQLNATLTTARNELGRLNRDLKQASDTLARNRQKQGQMLKRLAAVRLDAIREGEVGARIDSADFRVEELLRARSKAMSELAGQIKHAGEALQTLEAERDRCHDDVEAAALRLAETEAAAQDALAEDSSFQQQLEKTRAADAIAVSAAEKYEIAQEDQLEKGEPYGRDELFMYLWNRGYGTSEYRANPLARLLDAWVARLCRYNDARPNYWMLQEIPKRLRAHADKVQAEADEQLTVLQDIERGVARKCGVEDAQRALAEMEHEQDAVDTRIATAEDELNGLRAKQRDFASGSDEYMHECLTVLASAMEHRELSDLTHLARATMTHEDDAIIEDLRDLRRDFEGARGELEHARSLHQEYLLRVQSLEKVRRQFKQHRFDDVRSTFKNGNVVVDMMREVLGGAVRGGALWDILRRYQRYQDIGGAWPDFGSGGIARSGRRRRRHRPTWHWPGARNGSGRGGFSLPPVSRPPSGSRGGFRTGGRF